MGAQPLNVEGHQKQNLESFFPPSTTHSSPCYITSLLRCVLSFFFFLLPPSGENESKSGKTLFVFFPTVASDFIFPPKKGIKHTKQQAYSFHHQSPSPPLLLLPVTNILSNRTKRIFIKVKATPPSISHYHRPGTKQIKKARRRVATMCYLHRRPIKTKKNQKKKKRIGRALASNPREPRSHTKHTQKD